MSGSDRGAAAPEPRDAKEPREPPDLRLAPLVAGLWISQALIVGRQVRDPLVCAFAGAVLVAVSLVLAARKVRRLDRRALSALLITCGIGLGGATGGAHVARLHPPVLADVVAQTAVVSAIVDVTGDPRKHEPASDGGRVQDPTWSADARLRELIVRGRTYRLRVPVLLRGDATRALAYGSQVALSARAAEAWSPQTHAMALQVLGQVRVRSPPGPVAEVTSALRSSFGAACAGLPVDAAALLMGLAVGDESLLRRNLDDAMVRAGLSHLTAVSGSNTSLVAAIALAIVAGLGLGWRVRVGASLLVLAGYVALVRPQPSVLRAAAMGLVALLALTTGGRRRGPPALLGACLVLLVALPQFSVSLGFGLSAAATAGLLVLGPPLADRLATWRGTRWLPEPVRLALGVAVAAHVATLPLSVLMGNGASLVALPANVVVTPLIPPATVLGLTAALVSPVLPWLASVMAHVAAPLTMAIAWVAYRAAGVPHGVIPVPEGGVGAIGTAVALGLAGFAVHRGWRPWADRRVVVAVVILALAMGTVRWARDESWPPPGWIVLACDVGQGDGMVLRRADAAEALVVDVGPEGDLISDCLADAGIRRVVVLLTHFHADHIEGLDAVLAGWPVSALLTTAYPEPPAVGARVVQSAEQRGIPVSSLRAGQSLSVWGIPLTVLSPSRHIDESPENNSSVVILARIPTSAGEIRVLLTGDAEPEAQSALMAGPSPAAQVVKVPHHGSRYQNPGFATWSGARIALVSVGKDNDYGHPSSGTIAQYQDEGALVGRTDLQGALAVVLVGGAPALATER